MKGSKDLCDVVTSFGTCYKLQSLDVLPADTKIKCVAIIKSGGDKSVNMSIGSSL